MRLLLDTHAAIWWAENSPRLGARAVRAIEAADQVTLSIITFWEAATLVATGKLEMRLEPLFDGWRHRGAVVLDVAARHCSRYADLPFHHRDPFDRMMIAQALADGMAIMSDDRHFPAYGLTVLPCR